MTTKTARRSATRSRRPTPAAEFRLSSHCVMRYWAHIQHALYREQAAEELNNASGRQLSSREWYLILDSALNKILKHEESAG